MQDLLKEATISLRSFLTSSLPAITAEWWPRCVLCNLTDSQMHFVREKGITTLDGLDLAALLRVFDANYFDLSQRLGLPRQTRNWLKELQHVRNRWAHHSGENDSSDDIFRELDTLERFLSAINGDTVLIESVKNAKNKLRGTGVTEPANSAEFIPTQLVRVKASRNEIGPVLRVIPGSPQNRFEVFLGGRSQTFYVDQLEAVEQGASGDFVDFDEFRACLSALYIRHPGIATLYSLHAARVDYIPYQFRPLLKLVRSDRPRLLIADEVGVGKTIEAGLILRELQARKDMRSVLVLCPKALVTDRKWERDLRRFDERFTQLDSALLRHCIDETNLDGAWPDQHAKTIIPFSVFNEQMLFGAARQRGLLNLDPPPRFDLLIVDEAHHLRNSATYVHQAVRFFASHAEAVVFLTATPIQLGSDDLYVLLNLLRPDVIIDRESFQQMAEPNPEINQAIHAIRAGDVDWQQFACNALQAAAATPWGNKVLCTNPDFKRIVSQLENERLDIDQRVALVRQVEEFHTFARFVNRTRRRDIGDFTTRKAETVTVDFTPEQRELHDAILETQARLLMATHGSPNVRFMMTTLRRRTASCLHALVPFLRDILLGRLDLIEDSDEDSPEPAPDLAVIREHIKDLLKIAENLPAEDPKLDALTKIVQDKLALTNNKTLLFSTYRHTLQYLHEHLSSTGVRSSIIFGATSDYDRVDLRRRFALPKEDSEALDVLLSSEIGCEGLDYQFCDCMVNYDLPWNPMKIEQRIGRIDRYGQKSEAVAIYNLITPGTVDADIYERCLLRIGIFKRSIGGSEEILGEITAQLHAVAENLSLTTEERQRQLQQLADNKIRKLQEDAAMEDRQRELFGIRPPTVDLERKDQKAANFWVSPAALQNLVSRYLNERCGSGEYLLGEKPLKTLRLNESARKILLEDLGGISNRKSIIARDWATWLKGGNPHLAITFDAETARDNPHAVLITPIHPLALQAAGALQPEREIATSFRVETVLLPPGIYPFVIYQWTRKGIRQDVTFQPVAADHRLVQNFATLAEGAQPISLSPSDLPAQPVFDALEQTHYEVFSQSRAEHRSHEQELVTFQKASLQASHTARVANLREMISGANNDRIRIMREAELANAEADYKLRVADLDKAAEQADILAQAVARGVVQIDKSP